jgi:1,4-dihydroxy-2-naphthoyl-CoA hydrolase
VSETSPAFAQFDARVAASLERVPDDVGGIPGYLGIRHVEVGAGVLRAEVTVRDDLKTPFGNLHGGVIAALCDHVLGTVCYPVIPRGAWAATTEFKLNYLAPVTGGILAATAEIVSLTSRTAVVRVEVRNEGRLACAAQGTVLVVPPRTRGGAGRAPTRESPGGAR